MSQSIYWLEENYISLDKYFEDNQISRFLLVCDQSFDFLKVKKYFDSLEERKSVSFAVFSDFHSNPSYDSVVRGVRTYHDERCEAIVAVGGGSAMDVAKCIKLYCYSDPDEASIPQDVKINDIKLMVMPTTAGTGSEATRYAVIYHNGVKQSITDESIIPSTVMYDTSVLKTLPVYHRNSSMMDALCHAIESFWSINSTEESRGYSDEAIRMILKNMDELDSPDDELYKRMFHAAYIAGKAINITQTTAGHAMSYKLTSMYGISHGHAAAICDMSLFPWMICNTDKCIDARGKEYLESTFDKIADAMGCSTPKEAADRFGEIVRFMELKAPTPKPEDYAVLKTSVNPTRLKNHPIKLDEDSIDALYHEILK